MRRFKPLVVMTVVLSSLTCSAQEMLTEVLPVGYRDARELLQVLRPLVPAPGSISAFDDQLIVRTTAENLDSIRGLLLELDRAPANLLISVRHTLDEEVRRDLLAARARVGSRGTALAGTLGRRTTTESGREVQQVRVLEGRQAFIEAGKSIPIGTEPLFVGDREYIAGNIVRYENFTTGLLVRPRLNGERVTLDIMRNSRRIASGRSDYTPAARVEDVETSVAGELGRWMMLAGSDSVESRSTRSIGSSRSVGTRRDHGVFVKVERIGR